VITAEERLSEFLAARCNLGPVQSKPMNMNFKDQFLVGEGVRLP
jgi:hypothetical protein